MKTIAEWFKAMGVTTYYVGGYCRDKLLGLEPQDMDICLVGGTREDIYIAFHDMLHLGGIITGITTVHGNFPIWIIVINGQKVEFAMARTEKSTGAQHQDFEVKVSDVTIEDDLFRRDLTINAIAIDVLTGTIVDPFDGTGDIRRKTARPVSEAFKEDPLRVLRAARFIATFNLKPTDNLIDYCRELEPHTISAERVGKELMKLFCAQGKSSMFFEFLDDVGWLRHYFGPLKELQYIPQSPKHHPEGNTYVHSLHCIDACKSGDWFMKAVMMCHDLGKVNTTTVDGVPFTIGMYTSEGSKIQAIDHEEAGVQITKSLLRNLHLCNHKTINAISILVKLHMIRAFYNEANKDKLVRRALRQLQAHNVEYESLVETVRCDLAGRPPLPPIAPDIGQDHVEYLLSIDAMTPIVTGDMLIEIGVEPGYKMGHMIGKALEFQDRGVLTKFNWKKKLIEAGLIMNECHVFKTPDGVIIDSPASEQSIRYAEFMHLGYESVFTGTKKECLEFIDNET